MLRGLLLRGEDGGARLDSASAEGGSRLLLRLPETGPGRVAFSAVGGEVGDSADRRSSWKLPPEPDAPRSDRLEKRGVVFRRGPGELTAGSRKMGGVS